MGDIEDLELWLRTRSGVLELLAHFADPGLYTVAKLTALVVTGSLAPEGDNLALRYGLRTLIPGAEKATIAWLKLVLHIMECPICPGDCETREHLDRCLTPLTQSIATEITELLREAHGLDDVTGEQHH